MTTIVYKHSDKTIACDGRSTNDYGIISDTACKYLQIEDCLVFTAGRPSESHLWQILLSDGMFQTDSYLFDNVAIAVIEGDAYLLTTEESENGNTYLLRDKLEHDFAIGSGSNFAIAALDLLDCDVKQAIEYASKRDHCTGGKISVFDIEKGEFL